MSFTPPNANPAEIPASSASRAQGMVCTLVKSERRRVVSAVQRVGGSFCVGEGGRGGWMVGRAGGRGGRWWSFGGSGGADIVWGGEAGSLWWGVGGLLGRECVCVGGGEVFRV